MTSAADVGRILERYLVEVVERFDLCPWARGAREHGELAVGIVWGTPPLDAWIAEARTLLERSETRVAMVVAPELRIARADFSALRDAVAAQVPTAGVAEFHPDAPLDASTPARLVPFLRRAPDPLLQLVPLALLEAVRASPPPPSRAEQAAALTGRAPPPRLDASARIARANQLRVADAADEIARVLDDIADDRRRSYAIVSP